MSGPGIRDPNDGGRPSMALAELLQDTAVRAIPVGAVSRPRITDSATPQPLPEVRVGGLTEDSRQVQPGDAFVALRGDSADGHAFAAGAVAKGAVAVLAEQPIEGLDVPVVVVPELRTRRGTLAARLYGYPGRALHCVGITGTNGKTSTAHYLADLAGRFGRPAGYLGTIGWGQVGDLQAARLTTEDPATVQRRLGALRHNGCQWAVLEVSSHALAQERVTDVPFRSAVFTNLSRDHLDYHVDTSAYAAAKARLFQWPELELAVVNTDDAVGRQLRRSLPPNVHCVTYGRYGADVRWSGLDFSSGEALGRWLTPWGEAPLCLPVQAEFSVSNAAAALAVLCYHGVRLGDLANAARTLVAVPGRMERFSAPGAPNVVVDYAHTPDALEKALAALRPTTSGRLLCVFGCGGDRDPGKRPLMAAAAERRADELWITSDNPRSEDPQKIIADTRAGLTGRLLAHEVVDRRQAIEAAVAAAGPGDTLLVAGKGHEDYQEIGGVRRPFSDRALVAALIVEGR